MDFKESEKSNKRITINKKEPSESALPSGKLAQYMKETKVNYIQPSDKIKVGNAMSLSNFFRTLLLSCSQPFSIDLTTSQVHQLAHSPLVHYKPRVKSSKPMG